MKRVILLALAASAFALMVASADAATKPRLPLPVCKITGAKYYPAAGRLVGKGACAYLLRQKSGKLKRVVPRGQKWLHAALKATDFTGSSCAVAKAAGVGNSVLVAPKGTYRVTLTYRLWLPANRYHRAGKAVTKTVTVILGGKTAVCSPPVPVTAPEGPNSPTGSGHGGNTQSGFECGWASSGLVVDSRGIHIPGIDCSGNGSCAWVSEGNSYQAYGYTFYTARVECSNGVVAVPSIYVTLTYPDGTSCKMGVSDTSQFPLPPGGWYGDLTASAVVYTSFNANPGSINLSEIRVGPIHGTGTQKLCG